MNDSWESFIEVLAQECAAFGAVNEKALEMSVALVQNVPEKIHATQRALEEARKALMVLRSRRRGMQQRGFGNMRLKKVARYAPPPVAAQIMNYVRQLTYYTIKLELVNSNNRALILGAMERLMAIVAVMRRVQSQPLTYKRRGIVPPPERSMIVSHKA
jgi:flagellar biosynthesis/type III secretory pathway chaperone